MTKRGYQHFIGIDIGKNEVVTNCHGSKQTQSFENNISGWKALIKSYRMQLTALVVLEVTGGYELGLCLYLTQAKFSVHRANTRLVKSFVRSHGQQAKTDALDARILSQYGAERYDSLALFKTNKHALKMYELGQRRRDLKHLLVQEKNRLKAPRCNDIVKQSCEHLIQMVIDKHLTYLISQDRSMQCKQTTLESIPGIGAVVARELLCFMPELGTMNQKQVASLAGLAPYANDSGKHTGMRRIKGGRQEVRNSLFMTAMAAIRVKGKLQNFYQRLIRKGKKPMVALTAVMRKLIVIANAKLKDMENNTMSISQLLFQRPVGPVYKLKVTPNHQPKVSFENKLHNMVDDTV